METIGKRLKTERLANKLKQDELAKLIGVTQDSISLWENDKSLPGTQYIILLCKTLNISADYLLGLSGE